jgi:hypothetical protein
MTQKGWRVTALETEQLRLKNLLLVQKRLQAGLKKNVNKNVVAASRQRAPALQAAFVAVQIRRLD